MTWYREVVADLRESWKPSLSWEEVIALRARLQQTVTHLAALRREQRNRPGPTCGSCGGNLVSLITVRAVLFATRRFGLETAERFEVLDREWAKYRAAKNLDMCGEPAKIRLPATHEGLPTRQRSGKSSRRSKAVPGPGAG